MRTTQSAKTRRSMCRPSPARSSSRRWPASSSPAARPTACRSSKGQQGALKSQLLRTLAVRDEWFSDSLPHDLTSKDARAHLVGKWIVEMAEIAQFRRSRDRDGEELPVVPRGQVSAALRPQRQSFPRQAIFVGSTNATTYLHDVTGNRRFWPVRVRSIKLGKIEPIVGPALGRSRRRVPSRGKVVALGEARAAGRA